MKADTGPTRERNKDLRANLEPKIEFHFGIQVLHVVETSVCGDGAMVSVVHAKEAAEGQPRVANPTTKHNLPAMRRMSTFKCCGGCHLGPRLQRSQRQGEGRGGEAGARPLVAAVLLLHAGGGGLSGCRRGGEGRIMW